MAPVSTHEYYSERKLFHGFVPFVMGTKLDVLLVGPSEEDACRIWDRMCMEAGRLNAMLNRFDPASELSRLNASVDAGEVRPSPELLSMIRVCEDLRIRSGGLFDISRGTCGEGLEITPDGMVSLHGGSLDFGGFAKGFFLRECKEMLVQDGVGTAYVDFGGSSILALGRHPFGDCWRIRVTHPYSGAVLQDADLVDCSLSTSGNRPGYTGHILDPRSGRPVVARRIVTVLSPDPLEAEILSTAAMIADERELAALEEAFPLAKIRRFDA